MLNAKGREIKPRKTSKYLGFTVYVNTIHNGQVVDKTYKTPTAAHKRVAAIVNGLDDGTCKDYDNDNFSYCEIAETFG